MFKFSDTLLKSEIDANIKQKKTIYPIVFLIVFILVSLGLAASFMIVATKNYMENQIDGIKKEKVEQRMALSKDRVMSIIKFINIQASQNQALSTSEIQAKIIREFQNWYFSDNKNEYLFIYQFHDKNKEAFATMLVNPNRPDIVGTKIKKSVRDANGKAYRDEMLNKISEYGDAYVSYTYRAPTNDKITQKISYFRLYPKWNWIIATGVYIDDIETEYAADVTHIRNMTEDSVKIVIAIFALLGLATLLVIYISLRTQKSNSMTQIEHFKTLNEALSEQIEKEVAKKTEILKEREIERTMLMQQTKMAEMGSMVSAIAHQWKQPLNALSLINQLLTDIIQNRKQEAINDEEVNGYFEQTNQQIRYMSQTINDFKNFLSPSKIKENFPACESISKILTMFKSGFNKANITVKVHPHEHFYVSGYQSEFMQALLIILNNAKDAITEKGIKQGVIDCSFESKDKTGLIKIKDNAGGIPEELLPEKIFEAYFTTKGDKGTGIGLQIARNIIEKHMDGKLRARNVEGGAEFIIELPAVPLPA